MTSVPNNIPLVIRTDFENEPAWQTICRLIREPVHGPGYTFYANVEFLSDRKFQNLSPEALLERIPAGYNYSFVFVVDHAATGNAEFPVLVLDLRRERGRTFRAVPSAIQSIENNLSIANMDFFEFADAADQDGIFRGFRKP